METYNRQEKRKHRKINTSHLSLPIELIELKINNVKDSVPNVITDISSNGIDILSFKQIKQDSTIYLNLQLDKLKTRNIISKVILLKEKDGTYWTGLQFISISPKDFFNIYNYVKNSVVINIGEKFI